MKHLILTLAILAVAVLARAQTFKTKKYEKKDSGYVEIVYFPSGKISTIKLTPKQMYSRIEGYAKAYNLQGKEIFRKTISTVGGHGSTTFAYHPNGVIKSVRSTFQPDGGIQHYDVTRYYDIKGNFTHEDDNSWDQRLTLLQPPGLTPDAPKKVEEKPKQEITPEMAVPVGGVRVSLFVENFSGITIRMKVIPKDLQKKPTTVTVKPGERIYVDEYTVPNLSEEFTRYYDFGLTPECEANARIGSWGTNLWGEGKGRTILAVFSK